MDIVLCRYHGRDRVVVEKVTNTTSPSEDEDWWQSSAGQVVCEPWLLGRGSWGTSSVRPEPPRPSSARSLLFQP
jgi:hypothetical protein